HATPNERAHAASRSADPRERERERKRKRKRKRKRRRTRMRKRLRERLRARPCPFGNRPWFGGPQALPSKRPGPLRRRRRQTGSSLRASLAQLAARENKKPFDQSLPFACRASASRTLASVTSLPTSVS